MLANEQEKMIQIGFCVYDKSYKLNKEETIKNLKKIQVISYHELLKDGTPSIGRVKELEGALEISLSLLQQFWRTNEQEESEEIEEIEEEELS